MEVQSVAMELVTATVEVLELLEPSRMCAATEMMHMLEMVEELL